MKATLLRDVSLKSGKFLLAGETAEVVFKTEKVQGIERNFMEVTMPFGNITFRTTHYSMFFKKPSPRTLERWGNDGVAKSVTGKRVELDGYGPDGSPSWFLAMGLI